MTMGRRRGLRGFTLVEMLVSIGLGILVILGVGQIFVATRTSYSAQQGLSAVQQNGRFAMGFIGPAVRSAGDQLAEAPVAKGSARLRVCPGPVLV
jgi:Tfp pilus assembly protein PilW